MFIPKKTSFFWAQLLLNYWITVYQISELTIAVNKPQTPNLAILDGLPIMSL